MTLRNQCTHRQCWFQFSAQKHLDFYSLRPAGSSHGPRCSFKRGAGPGYRRGRAGPQSSFSFLIHSKITHCKFPDCWERRRKGAEERGLLRAPSRGHPGPEWRPAGRAESGSQFWLRWPHQEASVSTPGNLRAPPAPPPAPGSGSPSPSPLPRAGPPPSWALRLGCLPGRWLAAEHGSVRPPQPARHGCERGAVQQSHPAEEPPAAPRDHQAWIGAGRAAVHGVPQSPRVSGRARCPGDPSRPTRPALGFAPARLPYPAGGALPAAHDLLGAGWARGRPGTRLLRHQGAGEGAAPERWARGWLGMPTMRRVPVRGTPTGEGTRFESTGLWQAPGLRGCC